jgi:ABC-2 type transport system ATP-binding protein
MSARGDDADLAIEVNAVAKRFGAVAALDGVTIDVPRRSVFGLVGANGAGKTTLLRILVGALRADSGSVRVIGLDPWSDRRRVRPDVGYMPQASVLYGDLTARENVAFFARGHLSGDVRGSVADALAFADLGEFADRPVRTLSGGVRQRVSLAATLVHQPDVLFLDEPTAGVDPELRRQFWMRFRRLADSGSTLIVSTHQMDEVVHCDRVAVLRSGRVLATATPKELIASGGASIRVRTGDHWDEFRVDFLPDDLADILHKRGLDPAVTRIEVEGPTLEDVILELIDSDEEESGGA